MKIGSFENSRITPFEEAAKHPEHGHLVQKASKLISDIYAQEQVAFPEKFLAAQKDMADQCLMRLLRQNPETSYLDVLSSFLKELPEHEPDRFVLELAQHLYDNLLNREKWLTLAAETEEVEELEVEMA